MDVKLNVAGFAAELTVADRELDEVYRPILERVIRPGAGRSITFIAGPPGSGKSTFAALLQAIARSLRNTEILILPMDGLHFPYAYLKTHFAEQDGVQVSLAHIKGAPESFDLVRFTEALRSLHAGRDLVWPVYDRRVHDVVPEGIRIQGDGFFLVEGNYLLLDEPDWRDLRAFAGLRVRLAAPEDLLIRRLIDRQVRGGRDPETARAWVLRSDLANLRRVMSRQLPADLEVEETGTELQLKL